MNKYKYITTTKTVFRLHLIWCQKRIDTYRLSETQGCRRVPQVSDQMMNVTAPVKIEAACGPEKVIKWALGLTRGSPVVCRGWMCKHLMLSNDYVHCDVSWGEYTWISWNYNHEKCKCLHSYSPSDAKLCFKWST